MAQDERCSKSLNESLSVFEMRDRDIDQIKNSDVLIKKIQKLKFENRELAAKNKRLIQIITDVTKGIKNAIDESDRESDKE